MVVFADQFVIYKIKEREDGAQSLAFVSDYGREKGWRRELNALNKPGQIDVVDQRVYPGQ